MEQKKLTFLEYIFSVYTKKRFVEIRILGIKLSIKKFDIRYKFLISALKFVIRLFIPDKDPRFCKVVFVYPREHYYQATKLPKLIENIDRDVYILRFSKGWLIDLSVRDMIMLLKSPIIISERWPDGHILNFAGKNKIFIWLWHGCGAFKRIETQKSLDIGSTVSQSPDYMIVSSESVREYYASAYKLPLENVLGLGLPRTETFYDSEHIAARQEVFYTKYPDLKNKKIYLYVPTFREEPFGCLSHFDLNEFSQQLNDDEVLIYRLHPHIIRFFSKYVSQGVCDFASVDDNVIDMNREETFDLIMVSDVVMTDYSSAFFEALLLNKPCVFVASDIDNYERGFYINYREDLPGEVVESREVVDVLEALRRASIDNPNYEKFKEFHLGNCKPGVTEQVANFINEKARELM